MVLLVFPFRARLVQQGPKHRGVGWGELGAHCQMPPAAALCHSLPESLCRVPQHRRPAQGETLGFSLVPHCCVWITLAKGAGLACCRLCLQLLSQAVWKLYT